MEPIARAKLVHVRAYQDCGSARSDRSARSGDGLCSCYSCEPGQTAPFQWCCVYLPSIEWLANADRVWLTQCCKSDI